MGAWKMRKLKAEMDMDRDGGSGIVIMCAHLKHEYRGFIKLLWTVGRIIPLK